MFVEIQELRVFNKIKDWTELTTETLSQIVEKVALIGLG